MDWIQLAQVRYRVVVSTVMNLRFQ